MFEDLPAEIPIPRGIGQPSCSDGVPGCLSVPDSGTTMNRAETIVPRWATRFPGFSSTDRRSGGRTRANAAPWVRSLSGAPTFSPGYIDSADKTAVHFPADEESGAIDYRTGDLGLERDDGCIEYHGRADRMVKIRGYRVELDAVEAEVRSMGLCGAGRGGSFWTETSS